MQTLCTGAAHTSLHSSRNTFPGFTKDILNDGYQTTSNRFDSLLTSPINLRTLSYQYTEIKYMSCNYKEFEWNRKEHPKRLWCSMSTIY